MDTAEAFPAMPAPSRPDVPPGFRPLRLDDGFMGHNGPLYARRDSVNGQTVFGFRVMPHLCNRAAICHGGWLSSAMDTILPLTARLDGGVPGNFLFTVQLSLDFVEPAKLGDWVEGRAEVLRRTKRMVFIQGLLDLGGSTCVRGSGIFRIGPEAPAVEF